ncbi:hypothetical protein LSH36_37g05003 [Paralvinella palmiformis]|uniref:Uncharacterized protein n=1 Tax=Paralvinella palmiformis TaxID=53620 RepID=A0AAD9K8W9_9ANNE|nr:hypothetical protein LSH36_37g05003 [Paralvinella palmiformis]
MNLSWQHMSVDAVNIVKDRVGEDGIAGCLLILTRRMIYLAAIQEMVAFLTERIHIYMDQVALPVMPKPIVDGKLATKDGFYSPGWCTKEELLIYQQYSQGYIKSRRETTCNMYDGDDETCNIP